MPSQPTVFISYSHKDEVEKDKLLEHLRVLQIAADLIGVWSQDQISPGMDWKSEVNQVMVQAKVAVLLVTANFLSSELIVNQEVPKLLERHHQEGLKIFPLIARACSWEVVEWLTQLEIRPKHHKPIWREGGLHVDEELAVIAKEVAATVKKLQVTKPDQVTAETSAQKWPSQKIEIPGILLEELAKDNVVVFCGEGISTLTGGLPGHQQLAEALAKDGNLGDIEGKTLSEVAQIYKSEVGYHRLISKLTDLIKYEQPYHPLLTHQLIASLPFKRIITTNWDELLEEAFKQNKKPFRLVVEDSDLPFVESQLPCLIKLRGSLDRRETLVITEDDYYDLFARSAKITNRVADWFAQNTVLFLGFDLVGQDFKQIYRNVSRSFGRFQKMAYAVQPQPDSREVRYWENNNIRFIDADILDFLQTLNST